MCKKCVIESLVFVNGVVERKADFFRQVPRVLFRKIFLQIVKIVSLPRSSHSVSISCDDLDQMIVIRFSVST